MDYSEELNLAYTDLKHRVNEYGHQMALRVKGEEYRIAVANDPAMKFIVCPDEYIYNTKSQMPIEEPSMTPSTTINKLLTHVLILLDDTDNSNAYKAPLHDIILGISRRFQQHQAMWWFMGRKSAFTTSSGLDSRLLCYIVSNLGCQVTSSQYLPRALQRE